jgi:hypothetical protein
MSRAEPTRTRWANSHEPSQLGSADKASQAEPQITARPQCPTWSNRDWKAAAPTAVRWTLWLEAGVTGWDPSGARPRMKNRSGAWRRQGRLNCSSLDTRRQRRPKSRTSRPPTPPDWRRWWQHDAGTRSKSNPVIEEASRWRSQENDLQGAMKCNRKKYWKERKP